MIVTSLDDDDGDDHAVDTQDTGHDDGYDGFHDEFWFEDTHGADADSCFCGSVGGSEVGEDEGGGNSDVSEEILRSLLSHLVK